ncbi:MAG: hypothetical protein C0401_02545 [Anaerolinea sp.]|nr:hypothetical protein [Anaerolinea sp.]
MRPMKSTIWLNQKSIKLAMLVVLLVIITFWFILTPAGVDGKTGAAGYAVCHRIASHTLLVGGRLLPLCSRCTGMFLGTLIALMVLAPNDKRSGSPPKMKIIVLGVFFLLFVVDGVNSALSLFPNIHPLYQPSNLLRLITGLMMGIILANLLLPLWNQTLWVKQNKKPVLDTWKQFLMVMLSEAVVGVMVWLDIPFLYYPIAILSTGTIILILGMVYSLLWIIVFNKENTFTHFKEGHIFYLLGLITAFLQIGLMDLLRYSISGTWQGFQL